MLELLRLVGAVAGFMFGAAPLVVRLTHRAQHPIAFPAIEWDTFIAQQPPRFMAAHASLLHLGFTPVVGTGVALVQAGLYEHPDDPCTASIMATAKFVAFEFSQYHADGTVLCVLNSPLPGTYPRWRRKVTFRQPKTRAAASLFESFKRIRQNQFLPGPVRIPAADRLRTIEEFARAEAEHLVERGFYSATASSAGRPVTLKGAYLMSWKLTWPVPLFLNSRDEAHARRAAGQR